MTSALEQAQKYIREWRPPAPAGSDMFVEWVNGFATEFVLDVEDEAEYRTFDAWRDEHYDDIENYYQGHNPDGVENVTMSEVALTLYANYVLTEVALPGTAVGGWQEITLRIWFDPQSEAPPNKWAWEEIIDTELRILSYEEPELLDSEGSAVPTAIEANEKKEDDHAESH